MTHSFRLSLSVTTAALSHKAVEFGTNIRLQLVYYHVYYSVCLCLSVYPSFICYFISHNGILTLIMSYLQCHTHTYLNNVILNIPIFKLFPQLSVAAFNSQLHCFHCSFSSNLSCTVQCDLLVLIIKEYTYLLTYS